MKYLQVLIASALIWSLTASDIYAQYRKRNAYFRVGASIGAMNYQGDLAGSINSIVFTQPAFGVTASYHFSPHWSFRGSLIQGWITADDAKGATPSVKARNLSFRSSITELNAQLVLDLLPTVRSYRHRPNATPYLFGGLGLFVFNPKAQLNGQWIELQPLGTEGQFLPDPNNEYTDPYSLVQVTVPFGAGVRFKINDIINLELESGLRMTFTDYLDDVSTNYPDLNDLRAQNPTAALLSLRDPGQSTGADFSGRIRGNPLSNDWYAYSAVTVSFIIDPIRCPRIR